jgi:hypothetical protein
VKNIKTLKQCISNYQMKAYGNTWIWTPEHVIIALWLSIFSVVSTEMKEETNWGQPARVW